ncbi:MAG TPA: hypothetical protein VK841_14710 [Polyangiaceae bacterium]|jgi:hypothetical protein|nr:hypothetical protein [Polyangiaceae bacterium]
MTRAFFRIALAAVTLACSLTEPIPAHAQQYLIGATGAVSSGIEGGSVGPYRTRTRLRLGGDVRIDEFPDDIFEVALDAELEPRSSVGADLRYARAASDRIFFDAGIIGILAPSSLYGVVGGVTYRLPLGKKAQITLGPEADFYFLGSDLPDGTVVWELRFQGGFRVDL